MRSLRHGGKGAAIVGGHDDEVRVSDEGDDKVGRRGGLDLGLHQSADAVGEPSHEGDSQTRGDDVINHHARHAGELHAAHHAPEIIKPIAAAVQEEAPRPGPPHRGVMLSQRPLPFRISGALRTSGQHDRSSDGGGGGGGGSNEEADLPTSSHIGRRHHHRSHHHHLNHRQQQRQPQDEQQQQRQRGPAAALAFEHMAALANLTRMLTNGAVTLSTFAAEAATAPRQEERVTADHAAAAAVRAHWAARAAEHQWAAAAARGTARLVREERVDATGLRHGLRKAALAVAEARRAAGVSGSGGGGGHEVPRALELFACHVAKELRAVPGFSEEDVLELAFADAEGDGEESEFGGGEVEAEVGLTAATVENTSV
ncbi:hypothetical protein HK405_009671 [Cladochytrium tenue]|nr:hypothetical protein HK405_009671 [Cladochytrium tenue]